MLQQCNWRINGSFDVFNQVGRQLDARAPPLKHFGHLVIIIMPIPIPPAGSHAPVRQGRLIGSGLRGTTTSSSGSARGSSVRGGCRRKRTTAVPESLLHDTNLNEDISCALPNNYSFEIHKTIHRIRELDAKIVGLQFPEGLLLFATTISDLLRKYTNCKDVVILGDVSYGACCVDDLSAKALGCDLLIHYGHSCLVPVTECVIPMLYIFVHIGFDMQHFLSILKTNFTHDSKIAIIGTIQFVDTLQKLKSSIEQEFTNVYIPQARPLSPGEVLGCTSPKLELDSASLIYIGDGRFHLESVMIANPHLEAYRYDPYTKRMTTESYDHASMRQLRQAAVTAGKQATRYGIILGTLGRQGSSRILRRLLAGIRVACKQCVVILVSEITRDKLQTLERGGVECWIQIACPRLSIDWGHCFGRCPLLNAYEGMVAVGMTTWREQYPMDYYARNGGEWTNYYKPSKTPAS